MPDRHRRSSPQPRPSRKAVLLAGGRPVLTSLRGRETHTGLEAPAVCTILHREGRRTVPMREPRAGDAGGDRARLRGRHADGAATGHSEDTDARAARGGWRGDAQTPVPRRPHGAPAFGVAESPRGTCRGAAAWHGVTVACGTEGNLGELRGFGEEALAFLNSQDWDSRLQPSFCPSRRHIWVTMVREEGEKRQPPTNPRAQGAGFQPGCWVGAGTHHRTDPPDNPVTEEPPSPLLRG